MNTSSLKSFAPEIRRQLMEAVERKLDYVLSADTADLRALELQVDSLQRKAEKDRAGLVERVAYTWFNRLAALRFLDARGWHLFGSRVLMAANQDETQPELLKLFRAGSLPEELRVHTDSGRLNDLLDGRLPTAIAGADAQGEVYRHLVLAACRFYHATMPFLFEALDDDTELLLLHPLLPGAIRGDRTFGLKKRIPSNNRVRPEGIDESMWSAQPLARRGGGGFAIKPSSWHREEVSLAFSDEDGTNWSKPVVIARQKGGWLSYPRLFEPTPGEIKLSLGFNMEIVSGPKAVPRGALFLALREEDFITPASEGLSGKSSGKK